MSFISKNKSLLYIASCLFVLLACGGRAALGQIGAGSLTFVIDNVTAENGVSDGGTGAPITLGTSLLAGVGVHGVSGNGGSTSVQCYANGSEIFSWNTSSDGQDNFNWKPTVTGEYSLYCSGTWTGRYANGTVTTPTINIAVTYTTISGYINPKYLVLGVEYVTPGSASFSEYCNNTTVGSTNTITNTFTSTYQQGVSVSLSESFIGGWLSGTSTNSNSTTQTQTLNSSNEVAISDTSSTCVKYPGASDDYQPNNHDYDIIKVWLNPVALLTYTENPNGTIVATQWNGWGYNAKDQPAMDIAYEYVGCLNGDLKGCDLSALNRTWDTTTTWPSGQGPALTAADYKVLLSADPFASCEPGTPLTKECTVTPAAARFTETDNQDIIYEQPPVGAQPITIIYTLTYTTTDTTGKTETLLNSDTFGVESVFKAGAFGDAVSITTNTSQTFSTTYESNQTLFTTDTNSAEGSITGPPCTVSGQTCNPLYPSVAYPGPTEFDVYQDNLYGTFLYYPATWLN